MDKTHGMAQDWQFTELLPYDAKNVSDENAQFHRVYSSKNQLGDVIHFKKAQLENGIGYFSGQIHRSGFKPHIKSQISADKIPNHLRTVSNNFLLDYLERGLNGFESVDVFINKSSIAHHSSHKSTQFCVELSIIDNHIHAEYVENRKSDLKAPIRHSYSLENSRNDIYRSLYSHVFILVNLSKLKSKGFAIEILDESFFCEFSNKILCDCQGRTILNIPTGETYLGKPLVLQANFTISGSIIEPYLVNLSRFARSKKTKYVLDELSSISKEILSRVNIEFTGSVLTSVEQAKSHHSIQFSEHQNHENPLNISLYFSSCKMNGWVYFYTSPFPPHQILSRACVFKNLEEDLSELSLQLARARETQIPPRSFIDDIARFKVLSQVKYMALIDDLNEDFLTKNPIYENYQNEDFLTKNPIYEDYHLDQGDLVHLFEPNQTMPTAAEEASGLYTVINNSNTETTTYASSSGIYHKLSKYPLASGSYKTTCFGYCQGSSRTLVVSFPKITLTEMTDPVKIQRILVEQERENRAIDILKSDEGIDLNYFLIPEVTFIDAHKFEHRFSGFCDLGTFNSLVNYPLSQRLDPIIQCVTGLNYLHRQLVHRDIKPDNILLYTRNNGTVGAKIIDFGLSKSIHEQASAAGTPKYYASELFISGNLKVENNCSFKSDYFSLGLTIGKVFFKIPIYDVKTVKNRDELIDLHLTAFQSGRSYLQTYLGMLKRNPMRETPTNYQKIVSELYQITWPNPAERPGNTEKLLESLQIALNSDCSQFPDEVPLAN